MADVTSKIIIAGVGGQGVVFLTEILVDAAVYAGISAATSEIHGLSQRGGSVVAGVTFGKNSFGFVENGGADFLLGLELLETQRSIGYLNNNSVVIADDTKISPHSVNAQMATYPDADNFISYLQNNVRETIYIKNEYSDIAPVLRNLVVLGKAAAHKDFPVKPEFLEAAIKENSRGNPEISLTVFRNALNNTLKNN